MNLGDILSDCCAKVSSSPRQLHRKEIDRVSEWLPQAPDTLNPKPESPKPNAVNIGALIGRIGFWGDCGQKSEANTLRDALCINQFV